MKYTYHDFQKKDKKRFENLLGLSCSREAERFLKNNLSLYQNTVSDPPEDCRKPYWKIANKFKNFSKHLVQKYDGYSHRDLPTIIAKALLDGFLTDKDIEDFSEDTKTKLNEMKEWLRKF